MDEKLNEKMDKSIHEWKYETKMNYWTLYFYSKYDEQILLQNYSVWISSFIYVKMSQIFKCK